jgi:hypothetical protein
MKALLIRFSLLVAAVFCISLASIAQSKSLNSNEMKTYVIEREIPGAGDLTADQLKGISQTSCGVLKQMNDIQWIHSYVTGNKIYCIYKAKNEELIKEHAKKGGFPANKISEVANVISPATAD